MSCTRKEFIEIAKKYLGCNEYDGTHKKIIDIYNSKKPRARGYRVKYDDAWCSTYTSAVAIEANATDIVPIECGCDELITLAKRMGIWVENDGYIPDVSDLVLYDWDDNGKGDCKGDVEHVGIVEHVGTSTMTIIEGNYSNSVKRRTLAINGRYIRGYIVPKFKAESKPKTETTTKEVKATKSAKSFDANIAGKYKTTTALHLRNGAGTTQKSLTIIPDNTVVHCYGYYTEVLGRKWFLVQFTKNGVKYTGYASSKYLVK